MRIDEAKRMMCGMGRVMLAICVCLWGLLCVSPVYLIALVRSPHEFVS